MVQKFPNLLVLEEAGTETVSPVLRAYGLVSATRGTKFRSRSEEEERRLRNVMHASSLLWRSRIKPDFLSASS